MTRNIDRFERVVRLLLAAASFFAATVLFQHPVARLLAAAFGLLALWEGCAGICPLHFMLGARSPSEPLPSDVTRLLGLGGVQLSVAYAWWSAAEEKLSNPEFLAGMGKTLGYFASKNPFPWYKGFLEGFAAKYAAAFGGVVEWGQAAIAFVLVAAIVETLWGKGEGAKRKALLASSLALVGGMLMNANFYFAAGWTGPGTKGMNVVMFWVQAALLYVWLREFSGTKKAKS